VEGGFRRFGDEGRRFKENGWVGIIGGGAGGVIFIIVYDDSCGNIFICEVEDFPLSKWISWLLDSKFFPWFSSWWS
jgi:hypothetical protein